MLTTSKNRHTSNLRTAYTITLICKIVSAVATSFGRSIRSAPRMFVLQQRKSVNHYLTILNWEYRVSIVFLRHILSLSDVFSVKINAWWEHEISAVISFNGCQIELNDTAFSKLTWVFSWVVVNGTSFRVEFQGLWLEAVMDLLSQPRIFILLC